MLLGCLPNAGGMSFSLSTSHHLILSIDYFETCRCPIVHLPLSARTTVLVHVSYCYKVDGRGLGDGISVDAFVYSRGRGFYSLKCRPRAERFELASHFFHLCSGSLGFLSSSRTTSGAQGSPWDPRDEQATQRNREKKKCCEPSNSTRWSRSESC